MSKFVSIAADLLFYRMREINSAGGAITEENLDVEELYICYLKKELVV